MGGHTAHSNCPKGNSQDGSDDVPFRIGDEAEAWRALLSASRPRSRPTTRADFPSDAPLPRRSRNIPYFPRSDAEEGRQGCC